MIIRAVNKKLTVKFIKVNIVIKNDSDELHFHSFLRQYSQIIRNEKGIIKS